MAGIGVGGGSGRKRALNSEINMIPFIDLLMVTIAFLLITAVWVTNSRLPANAEVPGEAGCGQDCKPETGKILHVEVRENEFGLVWRQESTVVSETRIPRAGADASNGPVRYAELAKAIQREWTQNRSHVDPTDTKRDIAVLHSDNRTPFRELVAVLDAVNSTQRDFRMAGGKVAKAPAFNATFSAK